MTFQWLNKQGVRSADGYEVQFVGRYELEYREDDRTMLLEGESIVAGLSSNEFGFGFYDSWRSKRWNSPHQFDEITAEDRMRIRSNIINAFAFMNGKAEFD